MQRDTGHLLDETDIGSGEKKQGQRDTDKEVQKVRNPQMDDSASDERDSGDSGGKADRQNKSTSKTEKAHGDQSLDGPV